MAECDGEDREKIYLEAVVPLRFESFGALVRDVDSGGTEPPSPRPDWNRSPLFYLFFLFF